MDYIHVPAEPSTNYRLCDTSRSNEADKAGLMSAEYVYVLHDQGNYNVHQQYSRFPCFVVVRISYLLPFDHHRHMGLLQISTSK